MSQDNSGWWRVTFAVVLLLVSGYFALPTVSRVAIAATLPVQNACKDGQEKDAALCYPKCKPGYAGKDSTCWQTCPSGFLDTGDTCTKTYTKDSTDRGAGAAPTECFGTLEKANGLCYVQCGEGDTPTPAGDQCYLHCGSGQKDIGVSCVLSIARFSYAWGIGSPASCDANSENQGGFCYPLCKGGYVGVSSTCTQTCPAGSTDLGDSCKTCRFGHSVVCETVPKDKYSRGDGILPNQCDSGLEASEGQCYPPCDNGDPRFDGLCWVPCPSGWTANGRSCELTTAKLTYSRGTGLPPVNCSTGLEKSNSLCYPTCPSGYTGTGSLCQQNCQPGEADKGASCQQPPVAKNNYDRGAGETPPCGTGRRYDTKYTDRLTGYLTPSKFTLLFASDPQLLSWRNGKDPNCSTDACIGEKSLASNVNQIEAMNNIVSATWQNGAETVNGRWPTVATITTGAGDKIIAPLGVVMNGNLTNNWLPAEVTLYRQYYEPGFEKDAQHPLLRFPIFPGLGSRDYADNHNGCQGSSADASFCAKQAVKYIKTMVYCDGVRNFINTLVQRFDDGSLAYSYDIGNYHFVQLNNYPTYADDSVFVTSAIPWLKNDLRIATKNGYKVVLNIHDFGARFKNDVKLRDGNGVIIRDNTAFLKFLDAIKDSRVVAVFSGHDHLASGQFVKLPTNDFAPNVIYGTNIPVFRSGASEFNTFLLVEFSDDHMNVAVMNGSDGTPRFVIDSAQLKPGTYNFP